MTLLGRWVRSIRLGCLVGGLCCTTVVLAQEAPKLPVLPPPTLPTVPSTPPTLPSTPATVPMVPTTPTTPTTPTAPSLPPLAPPTTVKPAGYIPPSDSETTTTAPKPSVAKVSSGTTQDGASTLPGVLTTAREAHNKLRDYSGYLVRQERVQGKLLAEQTCELRYRVNPMSVSVKVVSPKTAAGQDTVYNPTRQSKVKHQAAGVEGIRYGYQSLAVDDAKVLSLTRHPMTQVGLLATIDRVEKSLATEKRMNHPVQVLMSDYTFLGKPCTRFEIFCEKSHPARYAHRMVLFVDKDSKLPVRFEAYDAGKGQTEGDLIEMASFVNLKFNTGLSGTVFDR